MDKYCIDRGRLLDNPTLETLLHAEKHSIHCLVDVAACATSNFEVLADPVPGEQKYCRAFTLDDHGRTLAIARAQAIRASQPTGFRVTVKGNLIVGSGGESPPILAVTSLTSASDGCGPAGPSSPALVCAGGDGSEHHRWSVIHGSLMILSWGAILPMGVISAHFLKHRPNALWFKLHRALQVSGVIIAAAGFTVALTQFDVFAAGSGASFVHGCLGVATMTLGFWQPINAVFRPHNPPAGEEKPLKRKVWEVVHKCSGYTAIALAALTIAIGTTRPARPQTQRVFQIVYISALLLLGMMVVAAVRDGKQVATYGGGGGSSSSSDSRGGDLDGLEMRGDANRVASSMATSAN
jgi:hypothetical protein